MKELHWVGASRDDLRDFPEEVKREVGFALYLAQCGDKALHAVPLVGFGSSKVLEIVSNDDGNTYRAVYTVKLEDRVYVLHSFQKKSTKSNKTPQRHLDLIKRRLKAAIEYHNRTIEQSERKDVRNDQAS